MLYKNLIKARREKGFTQKEIAELLAMEQTTYSKKERGITRIRENEWVQFAKILDKDVEVLKSKTYHSKNDYDISLYLNIIEMITKYSQKLEEENLLLKKLLKDDLK